MKSAVLVCGKIFDGISAELMGPAEVLIEGNRIAGESQGSLLPDG